MRDPFAHKEGSLAERVVLLSARIRLLLISLSLTFAGNLASAFQLGDHERITQQAYLEFSRCFPEAAAQVSQERLVNADLAEDLNLIQKELFYAHFYNPHKDLDLWWRKDSAARVADLRPILQQCRGTGGRLSPDDVSELGHAIHHFQDMAVPAHVVPVNHSLWDGFESYRLPGDTDIASEWSCPDMAQAGAVELDVILKEAAESTLKAVKEWVFFVRPPSDPSAPFLSITGQDFWQESVDGHFGSYGKIGNHFGDARFQMNGSRVHVADEVYREFKMRRMKQAVRATLQGLTWVLH